MNPTATKAQELLERIKRQKEEVEALTALWETTFPEFPSPGQRQFQIWLKLYDFDTVVLALEAANLKFAKRAGSERGPMMRQEAIQYASGAMKGMKLRAQGGTQ